MVGGCVLRHTRQCKGTQLTNCFRNKGLLTNDANNLANGQQGEGRERQREGRKRGEEEGIEEGGKGFITSSLDEEEEGS